MSPEFASLSHIRLSFLGPILLLPGISADFLFPVNKYYVDSRQVKIVILYSPWKSLPFSAKTLFTSTAVISLALLIYWLAKRWAGNRGPLLPRTSGQSILVLSLALVE